MNNFRSRFTKKVFKKPISIIEVVDICIHPFKELPSLIDMGEMDTDRINAYDLFSFYTADIIKEDLIFVR